MRLRCKAGGTAANGLRFHRGQIINVVDEQEVRRLIREGLAYVEADDLVAHLRGQTMYRPGLMFGPHGQRH